VWVEDHFIFADVNPAQGDQPKIVIGDDCVILYRFQVNTAHSVVIGRHVLVASNVLITDFDHVVEPGGTPVTRNAKYKTAPVRIQDNCWLGQNVVVLKGVTIGHDSIIGANSVVTRDVPPYSVVGGNPARIIKSLEPPFEDRRV
jgi:acetyltransferase-like isoleucine patch superfamily enzyme